MSVSTAMSGRVMRWGLVASFGVIWFLLNVRVPYSLRVNMGCAVIAALLCFWARRAGPWGIASLLVLVAASCLISWGVAEHATALDAAWERVDAMRQARLGRAGDAPANPPAFVDLAAATRIVLDRAPGWGHAFAYLKARVMPESCWPARDYTEPRGPWCGTPFVTVFGAFDKLGWARSHVEYEQRLLIAVDSDLAQVVRHLSSQDRREILQVPGVHALVTRMTRPR